MVDGLLFIDEMGRRKENKETRRRDECRLAHGETATSNRSAKTSVKMMPS